MRRVNLELKCQEYGMREVDHHDCSACTLEKAEAATAGGKIIFPRIKRFVDDQKSKPNQCLTCGSPSCGRHSADTFYKEGTRESRCHCCTSHQPRETGAGFRLRCTWECEIDFLPAA
uniref:Uncharacterized protein n=1 Tax=Entomoneis paludosa TaxID=265537 RepID=A0A7S2Y7B2_9STRA|mmetsp:Transcript_20614/g.43185  ORF Transcript_20614/g.43185 Transcript_20614/m.43185 type:complete len:117 (+) Transcript_20614:1-351(+)